MLSHILEKNSEEGVHLVLECVGGDVFQKSMRLLAREGRMIVYGSAQFAPQSDFHWPNTIWKYLTRPKIDPLEMISMNQSVMGFNLIWMWDKKNKLKEMIHRLEDYKLAKPLIGNVFSWKDVPLALDTFRKGKTIGKQIITCNT